MLDSQVVRVGFVTQLNWRRYGHFWLELVRAAGLEPVFADPALVREHFLGTELDGVPTLAFRLAAAQALALGDAGVGSIVVPELVRESDVTRGAGQDQWIMDFAASLRAAVPGLRPLRSVPSSFGPDLESRAVEFLQALNHELPLVRRALDRARPHARPLRHDSPNLTVLPGESRTIAVLGQPWLVTDALVALATQPGEHLVGQHRLNPDEILAEGVRASGRLVDSDAEVLGAARLLGRRAAVASLRLVVDGDSGSDAWLAKRVQQGAHKPLEVVTLQELLGDRDPVDALLAARLD